AVLNKIASLWACATRPRCPLARFSGDWAVVPMSPSSVWSQQRTPLRRLRKNPFGSTRDERIQPRTYSDSFSHVISLSASARPQVFRSAGRSGADPRLVGASTAHSLDMSADAPRLLAAR